MVVRIDLQQLAVRGHDLGRDQVVDGHAVLAHQVADPAAERESADADGASVAERNREALLGELRRDRSGGQPALGPRGAGIGVDLQPVHVAQVEHDAAIGAAVAGVAMPAGSNGQLDAGLAREPHHARDVIGIRGAHDDRGAAVIDTAQDLAGLVVVRMVRPDDAALDLARQLDGHVHAHV